MIYVQLPGALRCLVEGGGDVAFVKHTTVAEVSDGKRNEWWARNALAGDFELLCPDGEDLYSVPFKKIHVVFLFKKNFFYIPLF